MVRRGAGVTGIGDLNPSGRQHVKHHQQSDHDGNQDSHRNDRSNGDLDVVGYSYAVQECGKSQVKSPDDRSGKHKEHRSREDLGKQTIGKNGCEHGGTVLEMPRPLPDGQDGLTVAQLLAQQGSGGVPAELPDNLILAVYQLVEQRLLHALPFSRDP